MEQKVKQGTRFSQSLRVLFGKPAVLSFQKFPPQRKLDLILAFSQPLIDKISDALMSHSDKCDFLFNSLVRRFLNFVFDLSASEKHHDSGPGGLFLHSLDTVSQSLKVFGTNLWQMESPNGMRDRAKSVQMKKQWQFGVVIAALLHDIGKVFDVEVIATNNKEKKVWCPYAEGLYSFALQYQDYEILWKPDRVHNRHNLYSNFLLYNVIKPEDIEFLGSEVFSHLLDALTLHPEYSRISPVLGKSDRDATKEATTGKSDRDATKEATTGKKRIQFADDHLLSFCETVRSLYKGGNIIWIPNRLKGNPIVVGDNFTAISTPQGIEDVMGEMKKRGNLNILPFKRMQQELDERGALLKGGKSGNVYGMRFVPPEKDGNPSTFAVMFFKNEVLWGSEVPPVFTGKVEFLSGEAFDFVKNE